MTLEQLASIGEIISSFAVIISLVYLAIQIRTNTEAGRTSTYQSIVSDFGALNINMASTPELSHPNFLETEKLDRKISSYFEISNLGSSSSGPDSE